MNTITLNLTLDEINELKAIFKNDLIDNKPNYSLFQIKTENCTITAYNSLKVVFQGKDSEIYASKYINKVDFIDQVGNDEVGTGDFFGPVVVCSCIVTNSNIKFISDLKIQDSKNIKDKDILIIAEKIMKVLPYSLLIVDNKKYNEIYKTNNLNKIKARLHNKAFINLSKKYKLPNLKIIDQFTPEKNYYNYLKDENEIINNIHFETKAENKYISVACASIIARYAFLKTLENMNLKFDFNFLKGASDKVDKNIADFVKKYGEDKLVNVAKLNFKNIEKYKKYL